MKIVFTPDAWNDYCYWQLNDKAMLKKVNTLIKEAMCTPFDGLGKPEPLREDLSGYWSRRINLEHRLIYKVENDIIEILQCRFHY